MKIRTAMLYALVILLLAGLTATVGDPAGTGQ